MCGLAGFLDSNGGSPSNVSVLLSDMGAAIEHRGPDDSGVWYDVDTGVGLVHRRLSILDLSPAGHQPMYANSGRYVLAFNGEIYNHLLLRNELQLNQADIPWRGHSDTETLLAGFDAWGIELTLKKAIGMFAMAIWDRQARILTLVRDRLGEKPLYYGWQQGVFLFGSELRALQQHPAFNADIDRNSLALMMRHNCVPAPYSIFSGISKLEPGSLLEVSLAKPNAKPYFYWSANSCIQQTKMSALSGNTSEVINQLESLLLDAIGQQMMADVPLGAFLSGGVDSSTIVALMQAQSNRPVKTFTIGFNEAGYNEAEHAKQVAKHLGTAHTELYVSAQQALDVIPRLSTLYDEPFSDSSQIPTFLVAQLAKQQVTVSLSGDAGDELFCGYNRYIAANTLWKQLSLLPVSIRRLLGTGLLGISPSSWDAIAKPLARLFPNKAVRNVGDKIHKGAGVLTSKDVSELYMSFVSHWSQPEALVIGAVEPITVITDKTRRPAAENSIESMMALDMLSYLPDDILTKVDRAAMGVSLETRVPFLDHRVVEFAWRLPLEYKLREGQSKWALRQVLYKYVPKELIERPKMGFGVPIDVWLRGPLRDWAECLLSESRLHQEGFFRPAPIRQKWKEHLSGKRNWQHHLWDVLMFQSWLESFRAGR